MGYKLISTSFNDEVGQIILSDDDNSILHSFTMFLQEENQSLCTKLLKKEDVIFNSTSEIKELSKYLMHYIKILIARQKEIHVFYKRRPHKILETEVSLDLKYEDDFNIYKLGLVVNILNYTINNNYSLLIRYKTDIGDDDIVFQNNDDNP